MANWKWVNGLIKGNCAGCGKNLFLDRANGIVEYDSKHWHVHCLLDKLPEPTPAPSVLGGMFPWHSP